MAEGQGFTYKKAGVDVEAGNRAVDLMKQRLKSTQNPLVLGGLGGFGGAMRLPRLKDPVLVSGTDGVGTSTGSRYFFTSSAKSPPNPPMPASTSGRMVGRARGLMRSTSRSPSSMSTPASR